MSTGADKPAHTDKWLGSNFDWEEFKSAFYQAQQEYCYRTFLYRDDVTAKETRVELYERLAEFAGYKIVWPKTEGE